MSITMPKLSIIIPVYNTAPFLNECLDSIINQTLQDIEIIIVNDCSPDNSEDIILQYQKKDPRIIYIKHQENLGLGGARNTGIDHAIGTWITFIDSDDYVDLDTYQYMLSLLETHHANLALFSVMNFDHLTKKEIYNPYFDIHILIPTIINNNNYLSYDVSVCTKIFKFSDITNNFLRFPKHLKHEDEEFWFKYIASVEPIAISSNNKYYHYRQHSNSIMAQSSLFRKDMPQILFNIYNFLLKNNLLEKYRKLFIQYSNILYTSYHKCDPKYQTEFYNTTQKLFKQLDISDEEFIQYPNLLFFHINDFKIQIPLLSILESLNNVQNDRWYRFGQLSRKQKLKKILVLFLKKIHLYHLLKYFHDILKNNNSTL